MRRTLHALQSSSKMKMIRSSSLPFSKTYLITHQRETGIGIVRIVVIVVLVTIIAGCCSSAVRFVVVSTTRIAFSIASIGMSIAQYQMDGGARLFSV